MIFEKVQEIIAEQLGIDKEKLLWIQTSTT